VLSKTLNFYTRICVEDEGHPACPDHQISVGQKVQLISNHMVQKKKCYKAGTPIQIQTKIVAKVGKREEEKSLNI
jgi:hypothetical protein